MSMEFACSNDSQDLLTPERWLITSNFRAATLTLGGFLIAFMLLGIPWNILLIVVILKKRLFKKPAILLLLNLAFTNLLLCLLVMPLLVTTAIAGEFVFGNSDYARCRVCHMSLIMSILLLMSIHNVALLSLDRFLYVKKPLKYSSIVTVKRVAVILIVCWVLFTAFSILPVFGIGLVIFTKTLSSCVLTWAEKGFNIHYVYYWVFVVCACLTPVTLLLVTNTWMLCIMRKSITRGYLRAKNNLRSDSRSVQLKLQHIKDQIRLIQIFGALFFFSFLTWLPLVIAISLVVAADLFLVEFIVFAYLSILSQPVIHPILQVLFLSSIRDVILKPCKLFVKCLSKEEANRDSQGHSGEVGQRWESSLKCCRAFDQCAFALVNYNIHSNSSLNGHSTSQ